MPFSLYLPAGEVQAARRMPAHCTVGDPGTTEQFLFPNYIYAVILKREGATWTCWNTIERVLTDEDWIMTRYNGSLQAADSIYQYAGTLDLLLQNETVQGRVYIIASAIPLTFNKTFSTISTLDDVLNLTFDASSADVQNNLQHIYTSPYNHRIDGEYYGTFDCIPQRSTQVNMMLYHVAAKVDLQWNVVDSMRILSDPAEAVRLTYMEARRLYNGNAYCFRPLRNTMSSLPTSGGYDIPNIVTPADEGLWWEGRTYFYTIPYTVEGARNYFPLQLLMRTNGSSGTGYQLTLNQPIDTAGVFVPWIRGYFNFTQPLTDKAETKTAGS